MGGSTTSIASLDQMRTFARVGALGSFAAAARDLRLSPSAVSKQIRELEDRLGTRLLNRTTRRVSLTEAGRLYLERANRILEDVDELEILSRGLHRELRGTLRVSAPHDFGRLYLCGIVGRFGRNFPELRVEFDMSDRQVDLVEEGFDVAIRIANLSDSTLVMRKLGRCERVLCASPAYLESYGVPTTPRELKSHSCIEYSHATERGWRFVQGKRSTVIAPTGRFLANSAWALRAMVLADLGIALLPTFAVHEDLAAGRLQAVLSDQLSADLDVMALQPPGRWVAAKSRTFIDFVVNELASQPWWPAPPAPSEGWAGATA
jgi:DNA-binding transcriptional LysR family regulator